MTSAAEPQTAVGKSATTAAKTVLVTGSSRGLGRAMAAELGSRGHRVAVHYVRSQAPAAEVAQLIRDAGGHAATFAADVSDPDACSELAKAVAEELGPVEILVNNAGITRDTLALRMKPNDWQDVIDTNLSSAFHLSKAVLRTMLRSGYGRIVNVASVVGLVGNVGQANYVAAKAGLVGLTKALAQEYASKGITVNAVAPGFIESDMTDELSAELRETYLARIPTGRFGTAVEVAKVVAFLASDEASYVTGQTLPVDGGMVMH